MIDFDGIMSGLKRNPRLGIILERTKPNTVKVVNDWALKESVVVHVVTPQVPRPGAVLVGTCLGR